MEHVLLELLLFSFACAPCKHVGMGSVKAKWKDFEAPTIPVFVTFPCNTGGVRKRAISFNPGLSWKASMSCNQVCIILDLYNSGMTVFCYTDFGSSLCGIPRRYMVDFRYVCFCTLVVYGMVGLWACKARLFVSSHESGAVEHPHISLVSFLQVFRDDSNAFSVVN